MTAGGPIIVHVAGRTDVGLVREHNEDSYVVVDLAEGSPSDVSETRQFPLGEKGALLLVCDGMGGAAAGEVASAMAVETACEVMRSTSEAPDLDAEARLHSFARRLRSAAYTANARIYDAARRDMSRVGMGTTMTAVGVVDRNLVMAQVGDSRAYLLREGVLTQLTRDQSLVNELLETGQITEEQAVMFEHSNVILQALGVQPDVDVLLSTVPLCRGDRLVVCSDGLTGVVADEELGALAAVSDDLAEGCRLLIDMARGAGGPDNITAIVARFEGEGLPEPTSDDPPVGYIRWRLDEGAAEVQALRGDGRSRAGGGASRRRRSPQDAARTFFSAMVLFALAMGSLILATHFYRTAASSTCTISAGAPGMAIRVDGYDTGAQAGPTGTTVRLPVGKHRVAVHGRSGSPPEQSLDVITGRTCKANFGEAP